MEEQHNKICNKCKQNFIYFPEETWWMNYGTYSVKLCKCPECNTIQSVKFKDASGLDVNNDERYY